MRPARLSRHHARRLGHLLEREPVANLFLLGFLDAHPVERAWWYGVVGARGAMDAAVMILPGRLCVPALAEAASTDQLGEHIRSLHRPCMLVGPRAECDALWRVWGGDVTPRRYYDQRLYELHETDASPELAGLRLARRDDWRDVAVNAARMEAEDLGLDPYEANPRLHEQVVRERVSSGRTWVLCEGSEIVFQINVGTTTRWGCQVGGTFVPERFRGRGYAQRAMRALGARLLARHPRVTLHVNEANASAVHVYEKVGYAPIHPFRLVTV